MALHRRNRREVTVGAYPVGGYGIPPVATPHNYNHKENPLNPLNLLLNNLNQTTD